MNGADGFRAVDFASGVDRVAVFSFWNDKLWMPCRKRLMSALFLGSGIETRRQMDDTQNFRVYTLVDTQLVPKSFCRAYAIAKFDNRLSGKVDPENVDAGGLRGSARAAIFARAVAPVHVSDHDVLNLTTGMLEAAVTELSALRRSDQIPAKFTRLLFVPLLAAGLTAKSVPSFRST